MGLSGCKFCKKKHLILDVIFIKWSGRQDLNLQPLGPKPSALPNWATSRFLVRPRGVGPLTFWSVVKCSIQLSYERKLHNLRNYYKIKNGGFSWNRTNDTKIFSLVLCQLSYEATKMAVRTGLEPVISRVTGERDNHYTNEPWLREPDLNQQPLGYEPSELPDCSIPRQ